MTHPVFQQPTAALWVYIFVVIILLVLSWISAMRMSHWDEGGSMRNRGALGFLILAILIGMIVYFLVSANIQDWAWFVTLLPTAVLLFTIYFIFFAVFGRVAFWIGFLLALFLMIWMIYYAVIHEEWSLLAFPVIFAIIVIMACMGFTLWRKWSENNPDLGTRLMMDLMNDDL